MLSIHQLLFLLKTCLFKKKKQPWIKIYRKSLYAWLKSLFHLIYSSYGSYSGQLGSNYPNSSSVNSSLQCRPRKCRIKKVTEKGLIWVSFHRLAGLKELWNPEKRKTGENQLLFHTVRSLWRWSGLWTGCFLGEFQEASNREENPWQTQNTQEGLQIPPGLGKSQDPPRRAEESACGLPCWAREAAEEVTYLSMVLHILRDQTAFVFVTRIISGSTRYIAISIARFISEEGEVVDRLETSQQEA